MNNPSFAGLNLIILYPLLAIYKALAFVHFPHPLAPSIILLTILIRFMLYPLISSQLKASKKMQELSPHLSRIKEEHKGNSAMISQETMKLYKEHGVNPAAGCLPVLFQLPIIWVLYSVLQNIVKDPLLVTAAINKTVSVDFLRLTTPIDQSFFFLPLGKTPAQLFHLSFPAILILLVPVATGIFQYIQSKMMFPKKAADLAKKNGRFFFRFCFPVNLYLPDYDRIFLLYFPNRTLVILEHLHNFWYHTAIQN